MPINDMKEFSLRLKGSALRQIIQAGLQYDIKTPCVALCLVGAPDIQISDEDEIELLFEKPEPKVKPQYEGVDE